MFVLVGSRGLDKVKFKQVLKEKIPMPKKFILIFSVIKQVPFAKAGILLLCKMKYVTYLTKLNCHEQCIISLMISMLYFSVEQTLSRA